MPPIATARRPDMVPSTSYELAETLRQADLLKPAQLIKLAAEVLPTLSEDPQELAFALVQRGWLTSFQAEQLLQGKGRQLALGGYRLLAPLGAGGMGQVYKAWQKRLNRVVALKVILPELCKDNPRAIARFKREALAVAQLSHPNIVAIYDADEADGTHFIVLEYVDGPDLERLVLDSGPLPVKLAAEYVRQAALGLQHAGEAGLVHRDIKPSNLLITRTTSGRNESARATGVFGPGLVKILDMGLARMESMFESKASLTREGSMMGTPDYVAPEQARDASSVDIRADLYSLGGTLYFLLAGQPPFPDGTMMEKLIKHQSEEPTPIEQLRPDVPADLSAIIRKLMAKAPERRYQMPLELAEALMPVLDMAPLVAAPPVVVGAAPVTRISPSSGLLRSPLPAMPAPPAAPTPTSIGASPRTPPASETPPEIAPKPAFTVVTATSLQETSAPDANQPRALQAGARKIAVLRGHKGPVMAVAFNADSGLLATGGVDATVHLWSLGEAPRNLAVLQEPLLGDVHQLAFAPGRNCLVTGAASLNARMVQWTWSEPPGPDRIAVDGPASSDALVYSPDGHHLASASGSSVWLWAVGDGTARKNTVLRNPTGDVKALQFSPDSKMLVCGDAAGRIHLWKLGWLGKRPAATLPGHEAPVCSLSFSADGQVLASAGKDYTIRAWDGTGSDIKEKAVLQRTLGSVRQMLFLPDSDMLLTACDGGQVVLWKWPLAQRHLEWRLEQSLICSLALSGDGSFVAAGSSDGTVTIHDLVPDGM